MMPNLLSVIEKRPVGNICFQSSTQFIDFNKIITISRKLILVTGQKV